MKCNFSQPAGRRRITSLSLLAGLILTPLVGLATNPIYINNGIIAYDSSIYGNTVSYLPNIDATNFYNSGIWDIYTANPTYPDNNTIAPYTTAHTLNYTNVGTMTGSVGWEFDYGPLPGSGGRGWSANFVNNSSTATIQAIDGTIKNPPNSQNYYLVSYLLISATNIINKGTLQAGPNGELVLNGGTVSLARSLLTIGSPGTSGGFIRGTNFALDTGLYGTTWAQTNMPAVLPTYGGTINLLLMDSSALWDGPPVTVPTFGVQDNCSSNFWTPGEEGWPSSSLSFVPTVSDSWVANAGQTNEVRQAVFIRCNPTITPQIAFTHSTIPTNDFRTLAVKLTAITTNAVTLSLQTNSIYFVDTLGSETNSKYYINSNVSSFYSCSGPLYQPANYIVSRSDPVLPESPTGQHAFGPGQKGGNGVPANDFFFPAKFNFPSSFVSNVYSAYSVQVDNLAANPSGAAITNLPGRIRINAKSLDLTRASLSAQGDISIQASNLVGSAGAVVDCQNLSFNLAATNGNLVFTNLAKAEVSRLKGTIYAWSALWTNSYYSAATTNTNFVGFSVLVLDASGLSSQVPSVVDNLALHSTNITIGDNVTVDQSLLLDGQSFTLLGSLTNEYPLQDWSSVIAPNLLYFTNDGSLSIPIDAHFGDDTAVPYTEFVNNGTIQAGTIMLRSLDLQINGGDISTYNDGFYATVQSAELTGGGEIFSGGDIQFSANTLLLGDFILASYGALDFTVTNSLSDNGAAGAFYCANGFNLWAAPQMGDLSDTTIWDYAFSNSITSAGPEIDHAWAGVDYGPSGWSSGIAYTSNAPIGTLGLIAEAPSQTPIFHFYGTGGAPSNAMYVVTLDLSYLTTNAADLTSMIQIDPGMKIYFFKVLLGFAPPGGQTAQDYLQSQFPGQFIKMPNFSVTQSGSVDWNTTYQPIDGFGASSAWQGVWTTNQADLFFSTNTGIVYTDTTGLTTTNNGIGLSLLRNHIAPAGSDSPDEIPTTVETNIMLWAQQRGAKVWSAPWTPAADFKNDNEIYPPYTHTTNLLWGGSFVDVSVSYEYQAYASQLANYVSNMDNIYHINIYAVSVQNEPDADVTNYEACQWSGQQIDYFVPYLYSALSNAGVGSTKILLPESQNWPDYQNLAGPTLADTNVLADVGIIANHNYVPDNVTGDLTTPSPLFVGGKTTWETEVATFGAFDGGIANGMYWANRIYLFMTVAQVNAWHYWWLVSYGTGNGGLTEGFYDNYSQTHPVLAKRMFVLGQFSRFVRPGYVRIAASTSGTNLLVTAFRATNSRNFAIVAINTNFNTDVTGTFSLTNFTAGSVTPWMTSYSNSLAQMPAVTVNNSSFTYFIPAQSIVTFVGQGSGGTSSNIVISSTAYPPSGHSFVLTWNATTGATYSVHKTNVLSGSSTNWPAIITGYPVGGAVGGSLSYTDTTATVSPAFYRVSSP